MKATGIVRRIDDLGRVVVPKEIRISLIKMWIFEKINKEKNMEKTEKSGGR